MKKIKFSQEIVGQAKVLELMSKELRKTSNGSLEDFIRPILFSFISDSPENFDFAVEQFAKNYPELKINEIMGRAK